MPADRKIRMLDLFSGCGGMTRGFVTAGGFELVGAVEKEFQPAATYAANFGSDHIFWGDIVDYRDVPKADVVIGGPPCQGFSNLGKKNPDDVRNKLWREFVRVVLESQADVFVFENVDRFSRTVEYDLLRGETSENGQLAEFETKLFTLNAADFGAPQKRMRSIIIGSRIGEPTCPQQTHERTGEGLPNWRTVRDAIGELNWHVRDLPLPAQQDFFEGRPVGGRFKLDDIHVSRRYDDASLARFDCIPPGGNRFDLPWDLQTRGWRLHKTGAADVMGRLVWDQPSVTIRTEFHKPEKGRYIHPQWEKEGVRVNRALTLAEGALLQGFDDQHVWCGSKVGIARQIGNAVPPPLAEALAKQVKSLVRPGATVSEQPAG